MDNEKPRRKPGPVAGRATKGKLYTFRLDKDLEKWVESLDEKYSDYFRRLIREDYEKYNPPVKRGPGRPPKPPRFKPIEPLDLFPGDE